MHRAAKRPEGVCSWVRELRFYKVPIPESSATFRAYVYRRRAPSVRHSLTWLFGLGPIVPSSAPNDGAFVAVRFKPEATAADITKFLADNKANVVGGPGSGGMFKLRVSNSPMSDEELGAAAKKLAENPAVSFAAASR